MTRETKMALLAARKNTLMARGTSPNIVRKINRELKKEENK